MSSITINFTIALCHARNSEKVGIGNGTRLMILYDRLMMQVHASIKHNA